MNLKKLPELSEERELRKRLSVEFERLFGLGQNEGLLADLERLLEIRAELDERKALFVEFDAIVLRLQAGGFEELETLRERISLVDNFKGGNTSWTSTAVKRFDLKIESLEKIAKREARAAKKGSLAHALTESGGAE